VSLKNSQSRRRNRARTTVVDDDEEEYDWGQDGADEPDDDGTFLSPPSSALMGSKSKP